jgi:hypothetical protein
MGMVRLQTGDDGESHLERFSFARMGTHPEAYGPESLRP